MKLSTIHLPLALFCFAAASLNCHVIFFGSPADGRTWPNWMAAVTCLVMGASGMDTWWVGRKRK